MNQKQDFTFWSPFNPPHCLYIVGWPNRTPYYPIWALRGNHSPADSRKRATFFLRIQSWVLLNKITKSESHKNFLRALEEMYWQKSFHCHLPQSERDVHCGNFILPHNKILPWSSIFFHIPKTFEPGGHQATDYPQVWIFVSSVKGWHYCKGFPSISWDGFQPS